MNFLNFLTSGAGIFNFNLQNLSLNTNNTSINRPISTQPPKSNQKSQIHPQNDTPLCPVPQTNQIFERILTSSPAEILTHQQQLINQYMHLNIQLLSKKIQCLESQPEKKEETSALQIKSNKKKIKKENVNCGHNDRQHYAKGMCNNCYHKIGRTKKPWKCEHQKLYANGLCQNCYINKYNKMKREKNNSNERFHIQGFESRQLNSEPKIEQSS